MVMPLLEYGSTIWSNCNKKNMEKIESIHKRGTRYILNDFNYAMDYKTRLNACNLLPLSFRETT